MTTDKGVWNLQQVRDKQLQSLWSYSTNVLSLYSWGYNNQGALGQNNKTKYSSPVQIPGTTWRDASSFSYAIIASKTDNTLWAWGYNADYGQLGLNDRTQYSSPTQIPGTSWDIPMEWNDSWTSVFVRKDV